MEKIVEDVALLFIGGVLGVVSKAVFNPVFAKTQRRHERKEKWLEEALQEVENIQKHIQFVRHAVTSASGFDHEIISKTIIVSLTPEDTPQKKIHAVRDFEGGRFKELIDKIDESFRVVRIVAMNIENNSEPKSVEEDPGYAIQWFENMLGTFAGEVSEVLTAK